MTYALAHSQRAATQDSTSTGTKVTYNNEFSEARSCHTTALSGCNQPHEAYNPVGIHQMAQPSTLPVIKPTTHLLTPKG